MSTCVYMARVPSRLSALPAHDWLSELPDVKRERVAAYRREEDLCRALVGDRLLKCALHRTTGSADTFDYTLHRGGKPYLASRPGIHFSIAHSGDWAVCALSGASVGADVERVRELYPGASRLFLSNVESAHACCARDVIALWTLKESYLKRTGEGIAGPLRDIGFEHSRSGCHAAHDARFTLFEPSGGYCAAVCAQDECVQVLEVRLDELN